jgi:autotransporter-associated beta strand protein
MKLDLFSLKKTFSSHCRKLNWCVAIYIFWISFPSLFAQSILMDFAQTTTTSPDVNGNYWNNYSSYGALNLVTSQGNSTTSYFTPNLGGAYNTNFITGSPNLPALGVFNIPTVYSDAINTTTNCSYYFYNINQNLTYDFSLFGSRDSTTTRTTQYTIEGSNTGSGSVTTSGVGVGGTGTNYNTANLVNITGITSTNYGGSIGNGVKITIAATSGGFGYLNAMSMNGYIGYLNGGTTTLNGAPAAGYVANGTYAGTSNTRSVDTVIGGGSTVNVNSGDGIYYNSTLIMTNGGGSVNVGTNFQAYALAGAGNLALGGANKLSLNHTGTYSGTITLNGAAMSLGAANAIGTGNLVLKGGSIDVGNASALGTGSISVNTNTTTINNTGLLNSLTGNNAFNLTGGGTLQVNGYGKTLNLGTGNVAVSGFNNLNGWSGGMQFDGVISGSGTINWYGGGTLALGGANTFSGTVTASGNNGTLSLLNVDALKNATLNKGANHNVSFGLVGNNTYNLASLTGAGDINLGGNTLNITNGGTYSGNLSGTGGVRVAGGLLALSGANSYSGSTTVSSGTLNVQSGGTVGLLSVQNSSQAVINGTAGDTLVNSGGALSGSGSVGALSLSSGSLLNPGNSPGTLTAASAVVSGGSIYNWQISAIAGAPGTNWDLLSVTGLLDMSGLSDANKWNLVVTGDSGFTGWTDTNSYSYVFAQAANVSGFSSVEGTDITDLFNISTSGIASVPNASFNSTGDFKVVVGSSGGFTTLNLMAVPEPSAGALLMFGLGGLLFTRALGRKKY